MSELILVFFPEELSSIVNLLSEAKCTDDEYKKASGLISKAFVFTISNLHIYGTVYY